MTRKVLAALALLCGMAGLTPAVAQTPPNFTYGFVPTVAQWNALFAGKQDTLGYVPMNSAGGAFTGPVSAPSFGVGTNSNLPPYLFQVSGTSAGFIGMGNNVAAGIALWGGSRLPLLLMDRTVNWFPINDNTVVDFTVLTAISEGGLIGNQYASFNSRLVTTSTAFAWNHIAGFEDQLQYNGTGVLAHHYTVLSFPTYNGPTTMREVFSVRDAAGSGALATQRGFHCEDLVHAATNFCLYADGSTPNYLGGPTTMGSTLGVATSVTVGGINLLPSVTNKIQVGSTVSTSEFAVGQDTTHYLQMFWAPNATPSLATSGISTAGFLNPITIDGSAITINGLSSGATTINSGGVAPTGTGAYARAISPTFTGTLTASAIAAVSVTAGGIDLQPGIINKLQAGSTSTTSELIAGQDTTHNVQLFWVPNGAPLSATSGIATAGYLNPFSVDASAVSINLSSNGTTAVKNLTVTGSLTATALIGNNSLVNSAITINGSSVSLGGSITVTAAAASIAVGTTTVTGGISTALLFNNGGTLGNVVTLPAANFPALTGDVTTTAASLATTLATAQPAIHTWALAQTFTVAPVFTDQSGSRTALGLGSLATLSAAPAGTLTGATLAAGVTASSLTSLGTITSLTATTINAFTMGGAIAGGGNNITNVNIGTSTPGTGAFTTLTASTSLSSLIYLSTGTLTFQTNGGTFAGRITTGQQWVFGNNNTPSAGQVLTITKNAAVPATAPATNALTYIVNIDGTSTNIGIDAYGSGASSGLTLRAARGTAASPTQSLSGDFLSSVNVYAYNSTGGFAGGTAFGQALYGYAMKEDCATATCGGAWAWFTVTAGTNTTAQKMQLGAGLSVGTTTDGGVGTITALNGFSVLTAAKTLTLKQGANGAVGTFTCVSASNVTISNTFVAVTDAIIITYSSGTAGAAVPTPNQMTGSTSFRVGCASGDTAVYNYSIIKNAA